MTIYTEVLLGANLSQLCASIEVQQEAMRSFERGSTEPTVKIAGLLWGTTQTSLLSTLTAAQGGGPWSEALVRWNGSAWVLQADPRYPALNAGGTVNPSAALNMANQQIIGLAAGTSSGHVPRRDQCLLRDGLYAATGALNMGGFVIEGLGTPTLAGHATRKDWVEDLVANEGGAPVVGTALARGTQQTVTLGFQPTAVMVALVDADYGSFPTQDLDVRSSPALFTAGTGTELAEMIADLANTQGGLTAITTEVEYTATGFKVRTVEAFSPTAGTLQYIAWK